MSTKSNKLWQEIKKLPIDMFSLPNQRVEDHVTRMSGTKDQLFLRLNSPAVLPALETTIRSKTVSHREKVTNNPHNEPEVVTVTHPMYNMEESDVSFVIISYHVPVNAKKELQRGEFFVSGQSEDEEEWVWEEVDEEEDKDEEEIESEMPAKNPVKAKPAVSRSKK